jgi:hypothetical protein
MVPVFEAACHPGFGPAYPLAFSSDREGVPAEGGNVRFGWNEDGLHVCAELVDSRLIALNRQDEQLHFETGDVFELFVKPRDDSYYWEMYAIPSGNKSTLFFPRERAGMELHDFLHGHGFQGLEVSVEETCKGWNAHLFVPATQLTSFGAGWGEGTEWTVFCGRYNYSSEDLAAPELSMAPPLSATNYHLTNEYARLILCPS